MKSRVIVATLALSLISPVLAQHVQEPNTAFWIDVQRGAVGDTGTLGLGLRNSWRLWHAQNWGVHVRAGADALMFSYPPLFGVQADLLLSTRVGGWNIYLGPQLSWLYAVGAYGSA